jgi:hypothetical protein
MTVGPTHHAEFMRLFKKAAFVIDEAEKLGCEFKLVEDDTNFEFGYPPELPRKTRDALWSSTQANAAMMCLILLERAGKPAPINVLGAVGDQWLRGLLPEERRNLIDRAHDSVSG